MVESITVELTVDVPTERSIVRILEVACGATRCEVREWPPDSGDWNVSHIRNGGVIKGPPPDGAKWTFDRCCAAARRYVLEEEQKRLIVKAAMAAADRKAET